MISQRGRPRHNTRISAYCAQSAHQAGRCALPSLLQSRSRRDVQFFAHQRQHRRFLRHHALRRAHCRKCTLRAKLPRLAVPRFTLARLGARRKQTNCEMIALLALFIWLYLCFMHGKFWQAGPELVPAKPEALPAIDIIIPARDEAHTIAAVIASLVAQDYAGAFTVSLVDDNSTDGTVAAAGRAAILRIISGAPKPSGWSGKLWALSQGVAATRAPVLLFSDADVVHDPRHLSALVARLEQPAVEMVSEMVHLNCTTRRSFWRSPLSVLRSSGWCPCGRSYLRTAGSGSLVRPRLHWRL